MSEGHKIFLFIMGVIVSLELVCGFLIIMRAFVAWMLGPGQQVIVDDVTIWNHPVALSEPVTPEPVTPEPVKSSGSNVSIRVEASGEVAVHIDIGSDVKPQAEVRALAQDEGWSDF